MKPREKYYQLLYGKKQRTLHDDSYGSSWMWANTILKCWKTNECWSIVVHWMSAKFTE